MKRSMHTGLMLFVVAMLTACSTGSDPEPTAIPTEPSAPPTLTPGGTSVGMLIDNINTAWSSVSSVQTTFWTAEDGGETSPPTTGEVTIETTISPNQRHVVRMVDGVVVEEQIATGGRIFMKGPIVVAAIAPMVGTDTWVEVDPQGANTGSAVAAQIAWLLSPVQSPFATVGEETRALEAFAGEAVEIDGRQCQVWTFGEPDGIQQELAIDEAGLPCRLIQRAGGYANITLYEINPADASITIPPVATPGAP